MNSKEPTVTYKELAKELRALERELDKQGRLARPSRIGATAKLIERGLPGPRQRDFLIELGENSFIQGVHRFRMLLCDAMEFRDAWEATDWSMALDKEEGGRWQLASGGVTLADKEPTTGHGTYPRNSMFELSTLAHVRKRGYKANVVSASDVAIEFEDCELRIECKRLASKRAFAKNLNKAVKQLNKADPATDSGIILPQNKMVCVSLDKLFLQDFDKLRAERGETEERVLWPTDEVLKLYLRETYDKNRQHIRRVLNNLFFASVTLLVSTTGEHAEELKRIKWAQSGTVDYLPFFKRANEALFDAQNEDIRPTR